MNFKMTSCHVNTIVFNPIKRGELLILNACIVQGIEQSKSRSLLTFQPPPLPPQPYLSLVWG